MVPAIWRRRPHAPLFGEVALLGVTVLADRGLETRRIEIAAQSLEIGIVVDDAHGLGIRLTKAHPPRLLVEGGFRNGLLQHLAIKPERAGLFHGQRPADLAAELLELVGVDLAELFGGDLGPADLGQRRLPKALEDVGDAPDSKAENQHSHHDAHDGLAEPV